MPAGSTLTQKILPHLPENIQVRTYTRLNAGIVATELQKSTSKVFGIAIKRSSKGRVALLALAKVDQILVIPLSVDDPPPGLLAGDAPFENLLSGKGGCTLVGFDMPRAVLRIAHDMKLGACGIDLSTAFAADTWKPLRISEVIAARLFTEVDRVMVEDLWNDKKGSIEVCLRAWLAVCVAQNNAQALEKVLRVDTGLLNNQEIECLGELVRQTYVLEDARPKETSNDFNGATLTKDGSVKLLNARYRTRVRQGPQVIVMTNDAGKNFSGRPCYAKGKTTKIKFTGQVLSGTLHKVRVVGYPELTSPERARDQLVLHILQGIANLKAPFITKLWFPPNRIQDLFDTDTSDALFNDLNDSQKRVAAMMISDAPLVIAHGPPGTGKTTTIAAAASRWNQCQQPTWIVAHSNVAVKNIAETLYKRSVDFKILVSKDFHFECLDVVGFFKVVPVKQLVIDEASQIKIEDFMVRNGSISEALCEITNVTRQPIFRKFRKTLHKVCFFGDPKQLPPYGKDNVPEIKTIFDLPHLKGCGEFLDTQYRMPVRLGDFISKNVYGGRLKSQHSIQDTHCVSFVHAANSGEKRSGFSWTNVGEIHAMTALVKNYYKHTNFCIITPYDAQRAAIERQLKAQNLPWERVFNVDSFQGNEADFVLVSVVRSGNPGFLNSMNRMNVLLTRCRKGLVIVTSRSFLSHGGSPTLLGSLEYHWTTLVGERAWVDWRSVSEGKVDLPGAPGPNRPREPLIGASSSSTTIPERIFDVETLPRSRISPDKVQASSSKSAKQRLSARPLDTDNTISSVSSLPPTAIPQRIFDVETLPRSRISQEKVQASSSKSAKQRLSARPVNTGITVSSVSSLPQTGSQIIVPDVGRHCTKSHDLVGCLPTPGVQNNGKYANQSSSNKNNNPGPLPTVDALSKKPKACQTADPTPSRKNRSSVKQEQLKDQQNHAAGNTDHAVPSLENAPVTNTQAHSVPCIPTQAPKPKVPQGARRRQVVLKLEISAVQTSRARIPTSGENPTDSKNSLRKNDKKKIVTRRMK
ncbi:hypothetical protein H0H81_001857 [Sphagnurus paluster]|uniref:DNA2/NAM7 helicase-like C-terminal domain-containing protein n=1 Tax=Sphagnurus paluster TaxID=117069 RepID=A0A9P7FVM4_9AGAR|nr:hypothetical protein H0H81_001857 [Sphagnurus paluster]